MLREQGNVLRAVAQRRERDDVEGESVEQILPEPAFPGEPGEIRVGGPDDPGVGGQGAAAPDPLELTVLDHPQKLLLHAHRHACDLVEEQRATVRPLETTEVFPGSAGEGARFVTEQVRLEQGLR